MTAVITIKSTTKLSFDSGDVPADLLAAGIKRENDGFSVLDHLTISDPGGTQVTISDLGGTQETVIDEVTVD